MNRRIAITLALALCLAGCATEVKLLTVSGPQGISAGDVWVVSGLLVPDEESGTVLRVDGIGRTVPGIRPGGGLFYGDTDAYLRPVNDGRIEPVTWLEGYTGRQVWSEVEVLNASGEVVATTGVRYICAFLLDGGLSACETAEAVRAAVRPPPPLLFDLTAVKAKFEAECEDPTALEANTCEQIDIDGMFGKSPRSLWVPTNRTEWERLKVMCKEIARFAVDSEPLGFEDMTILASDGRLRAGCRIDG